MAEKEGPIANDETGKIKVKAKEAKQPDGNETKGDVTKVKARMKKPAEVIEETITKVNLSNPPEEKPVEEVKPEAETQEVEKQETSVVEEITNETVEQTEEIADVATEAIKESMETGEPLPENIQKLMDFMEDTGGDLNDYVKLNKDYSDMDNQDILHEHYKQTKPHLNAEEINFLLEDQFSFDEDVDDEREIRRKKLALKEQVASAKSHLEETKSKYYEDIKNGGKLTKEQQEAIDFFNKYSEEQVERAKGAEHRTSIFHEKTNNVFTKNFKGFEFEVGDRKFRYNVQDADKVKESQSDISNFVGKFLNKNREMSDAEGYHKSLYAAMNPDAIAKHFYEQGQSDALRQSVEKGKNINMDPRQQHGEVDAGGIKVRVLGDDSNDFKFKIKNNKFNK